jgi:hypothetical protein
VGKVKTDERSVRLREVAKEALKLASEATRLRAEQNARFTETRNFAGKMVEVETEIVEGSKEAKAHSKRVEMLAKGGLDAVLAELMEPKKLNVLDKTKADWRGVKDVDVELQEDLQHHQRGGRTYREHQDFLQQADYREYELERDARLARVMKTRLRSPRAVASFPVVSRRPHRRALERRARGRDGGAKTSRSFTSEEPRRHARRAGGVARAHRARARSSTCGARARRWMRGDASCGDAIAGATGTRTRECDARDECGERTGVLARLRRRERAIGEKRGDGARV